MSVVRTIIIFERKFFLTGGRGRHKNVLADSPVVGKEHIFIAMAILTFSKAGKCSSAVCSGRRGDRVFIDNSQSATPPQPSSCSTLLSMLII